MFPMKCMRCGRDTTEQQVFCDDCLADMARHPVKPDVAVYLPVRKPSEPQRKQNRHHKKELSAEELVPILRSRIWILSAAVVIMIEPGAQIAKPVKQSARSAPAAPTNIA